MQCASADRQAVTLQQHDLVALVTLCSSRWMVWMVVTAWWCAGRPKNGEEEEEHQGGCSASTGKRPAASTPNQPTCFPRNRFESLRVRILVLCRVQRHAVSASSPSSPIPLTHSPTQQTSRYTNKALGHVKSGQLHPTDGSTATGCELVILTHAHVLHANPR